MPLSSSQIIKARELRKTGMKYDAIAREMGITEYAVRAALQPGWREKQIAAVQRSKGRRIRPYQYNVPGLSAQRFFAARPREIPAHIQAERDRAMNAPRSITAEFCGDPPPGRSALDRRQAAE